MNEGSGTMADPYIIYVGAITYLKIKGGEWLGRAHLAQSYSDVELFLKAVRHEVLKLDDGDCFKFALDDKVFEPTYMLYKDPQVLAHEGELRAFFRAIGKGDGAPRHYLEDAPPDDEPKTKNNPVGSAFERLKRSLLDPLGKFEGSN